MVTQDQLNNSELHSIIALGDSISFNEALLAKSHPTLWKARSYNLQYSWIHFNTRKNVIAGWDYVGQTMLMQISF